MPVGAVVHGNPIHGHAIGQSEPSTGQHAVTPSHHVVDAIVQIADVDPFVGSKRIVETRHKPRRGRSRLTEGPAAINRVVVMEQGAWIAVETKARRWGAESSVPFGHDIGQQQRRQQQKGGDQYTAL